MSYYYDTLAKQSFPLPGKKTFAKKIFTRKNTGVVREMQILDITIQRYALIRNNDSTLHFQARQISLLS